MECPLCAKSGREQVQQKSAVKGSLFDHLVGEGKQRLWQYAGRRLADYDVIPEWAGTVN